MKTSWDASSTTMSPASILATGRFAAFSNSSRRRVTPGRSLEIADDEQTAHTGGLERWHTGHSSLPSSNSTRVLLHASHLTRTPHERHPRSRAIPLVLEMHTTRRLRSRRTSTNSPETSDLLHTGSDDRSITSTLGHPARSRSGEGANTFRACEPTTVGVAEIRSNDAPLSRQRSARTSRACHVGILSSWSDSSCSSNTTAAARSGHGAKAAERAPMTTSTPPRALLQSWGMRATLIPARFSRAAMTRLASTVAHTTRVGPMWAAESTAGN